MRRLALAVLALGVAACGPLRRGDPSEATLLIFTNESAGEATVYLATQSRELRRIGTVFASRTDTLVVPADLAARGQLNVVARLRARSDVAQTGAVTIIPGERYAVRLPPNGGLLSFLPARP